MVLENVFFLGRDVSYFHIAFGEKVTELERGGTCVLVYIYIKLHSWGVNWRVNECSGMDGNCIVHSKYTLGEGMAIGTMT